MKKMRKMFSILMVAVLALAMSMTAFAATTYSITIKTDAKDHVYEAYQIFSGDIAEVEKEVDGKTVTQKVLSNIEWGTGVSAAGQTALGNAAEKAATIETEADAKVFAEEVAAYLQSPKASTEGNGEYVISGLTAGYYLVKDQDNSLTNSNDAYTAYILEVVGNVEVDPKTGSSTVEKKVKDINDSTDTQLSGWLDSADHDMTDDVQFQLTATLAGNVSAYDHYKVVFHDTLAEGFTYNNDAVIKIGGKDVTADFTITANGTSLTFACNDVIALGATDNGVITVEYSAELNTGANLGKPGNKNTVYLEFSNNQYVDGDGSNDTTEKNETGKTEEDTVIVFTYQTVINKVDENGAALTGAEFTLEKYNKAADAWEAVAVVKNDAGTVFTFTGIDDGRYRLTETQTPDGYNDIDTIYFTVSATHDIESDNPKLTELSATQTDANGKDMDAGVVATFTANVNEGKLVTNITNKSGIVLPNTGGTGTTLIYVLGAVMMLGAAVLLITKKRMSNEK